MNDLTHAFTPWSQQRTFTGARIADIAKRFAGVHGERYGRTATPDEGLDTVGLIQAVAERLGQPLDLDRDWSQHGGEPNLLEIPFAEATPGDVLEFDFTHGPRARSLGHQLAILTHGASAAAKDAQIVCVPHAVRICWLDGLWHDHLVRAWRFGLRHDG
jgi:hypothetical protein